MSFIGSSASAAVWARLRASGVSESNTMAVVGGFSSASGGAADSPGSTDEATVVVPGARLRTWMPMPLARETTENDPTVCLRSFS